MYRTRRGNTETFAYASSRGNGCLTSSPLAALLSPPNAFCLCRPPRSQTPYLWDVGTLATSPASGPLRWDATLASPNHGIFGCQESNHLQQQPVIVTASPLPARPAARWARALSHEIRTLYHLQQRGSYPETAGLLWVQLHGSEGVRAVPRNEVPRLHARF